MIIKIGSAFYDVSPEDGEAIIKAMKNAKRVVQHNDPMNKAKEWPIDKNEWYIYAEPSKSELKGDQEYYRASLVDANKRALTLKEFNQRKREYQKTPQAQAWKAERQKIVEQQRREAEQRRIQWEEEERRSQEDEQRLREHEVFNHEQESRKRSEATRKLVEGDLEHMQNVKKDTWI